MIVVVADTTPLNYLILIRHIDVLASLYGSIIIPPAVQSELLSPSAPAQVRSWITAPPVWLGVRNPGPITAPFIRNLDAGEREAITLAQASKAHALLIDEIDGREEASDLGLKVIGTIGILKEAHERGLLNLREAITQLQATSYQIAPSILKSVLESA